MTVSPEYLDFLLDQLQDLGPVEAKGGDLDSHFAGFGRRNVDVLDAQDIGSTRFMK